MVDCKKMFLDLQATAPRLLFEVGRYVWGSFTNDEAVVRQSVAKTQTILDEYQTGVKTYKESCTPACTRWTRFCDNASEFGDSSRASDWTEQGCLCGDETPSEDYISRGLSRTVCSNWQDTEEPCFPADPCQVWTKATYSYNEDGKMFDEPIESKCMCIDESEVPGDGLSLFDTATSTGWRGSGVGCVPERTSRPSGRAY